MHLLATTAVADGGATAVDLAQSPGEIVVLSAADSDLACLAAAHRALGDPFPSLRLSNLLRLGHPLSVDLYCERTIGKARLVVVRILGGRSYWSYGVEQIGATCRSAAIPVLFLPGDDRPDPDLAAASSLVGPAAEHLWRCLHEGGVANAQAFLVEAARLLGHDLPPRPWAPVPRAGLYGPRADSAERPGERPTALVVFYRALYLAGDLAPVDSLLARLEAAGLAALGLFVTSLKDPAAAIVAGTTIAAWRPDVILNLTAFAAGDGEPLAAADCTVLQVALAGGDAGERGLDPRDLAMQVALPEIDGRILARAVGRKHADAADPRTQCPLARYVPVADRVAFTAELAAGWARLRRTPAAARRVAIVLANYPIRDGRLANGVGLDTPESCAVLLAALRAAGYRVEPLPPHGRALLDLLKAGVTNDLASRAGRQVRARLPLLAYLTHLAGLPASARERIDERWGTPHEDPHLRDGCFPLAVLPLGNVVVALQPSRGWDVDPERSWHDPDLPPPHAYLALHVWLRRVFAADAIVQLGKHGNLEWLPGRPLALSEACFPELALGPVPLLYPFIVNDPGEGSQAKRRAAAVIVDHLTPPLSQAGSWGVQRELERLVDEYWEARTLDPRRAQLLQDEILLEARRAGLDRDLDLDRAVDAAAMLTRLDAHLCDLKELQIRDGLHLFGRSPEGSQRTALLVALARAPRGDGQGANASLSRALAADLDLDIDPLTADLGAAWGGPWPGALRRLSTEPWRTAGDTVERLEALAWALVEGTREPEPAWRRSRAVLDVVRGALAPALDASGPRELAALLAGLDGRRVAPGPSGAPTRGRPEVLPTGRNFYSVDTRAVPTAAAWRIGWAAATTLLEQHLQLHGDWPRRVALSVWGTANMRTGGDDIAQALALLGCRPTWEAITGRVSGVEILPLDVLGRPRVDVTLRISGLFRDAFPGQLLLLDDAVRAVAALAEPPSLNPLAAVVRDETARLVAAGTEPQRAGRLATARLFGAPPGAYGTGLQGLVDNDAWQDEHELGSVFLRYGGHAYGRGLDGLPAEDALTRRLAATELVVHVQDNREHDLLDSDDYWQFEGGLAAAVRAAGGGQPEILHLDTSRPERPRACHLQEEIGRIVRGRAANPRWIAGVMRHGYKGAFEIAATVDYLFAFAATARVVGDHHFDLLYDAYLGDDGVRAFLADSNPDALREIAQRFREAVRRGLWNPQRNSARDELDRLAAAAR